LGNAVYRADVHEPVAGISATGLQLKGRWRGLPGQRQAVGGESEAPPNSPL